MNVFHGAIIGGATGMADVAFLASKLSAGIFEVEAALNDIFGRENIAAGLALEIGSLARYAPPDLALAARAAQATGLLPTDRTAVYRKMAAHVGDWLNRQEKEQQEDRRLAARTGPQSAYVGFLRDLSNFGR